MSDDRMILIALVGGQLVLGRDARGAYNDDSVTIDHPRLVTIARTYGAELISPDYFDLDEHTAVQNVDWLFSPRVRIMGRFIVAQSCGDEIGKALVDGWIAATTSIVSRN